jgi:predicted acylesterase/phospholipase RssA
MIDTPPTELDDKAAKARRYLKGEQTLTQEEASGLASYLQDRDRIGLARRLLAALRKERIADAGFRLKLAQRHANCIAKDPDLPVPFRLDKALGVLSEADDLKTTRNHETLGLAGAVYKRRWEATGQKGHLERSYAYYRRGYDAGPEGDQGYTGINAAFVLDQLASIEAREGAPSAVERRAEARAIRKRLVDVLSPMRPAEDRLVKDEWWFLVTLAEAHFGLGDYEAAGELLKTAKAIPEIPDWEFRTAAAQLATLHQLQHPGVASPTDLAATAASGVLDAFVESQAARESAFVGKVGLSLSGGGFRASLFHIGVLAKLAEADVLRRVEVLSCVSGGSIIGAHYYLQLREWIETADAGSLTADELRAAYIAIVERVAADFLAGVQSNIRTRVFANPFPLLRSVFDRAYTRTTRLGELFESRLFARVWNGTPPPSPLLLKDLRIDPKGRPRGSFDPKVENWRRDAKVPILILNATTLNTGHAWQYTASFMGESPWAIDPNIDGTKRLRRFYHGEAPAGYRAFRLSDAVVASACVPGLFDPVRLDGAYELKEEGGKTQALTLRQVDGGVHDNQGVGGLLEQGCTVLLVSDASGQAMLSLDPGGGVVAPLARSNSLLMERVRQEQFARLDAMDKGGLVKGLMILHLKRGLDATPIDWKGCETEPDPDAEDDARKRKPVTGYGVRKEIQSLLAGIRTDLDSFSDVEAFSLMTSGYRMAGAYLSGVSVLPQASAPHAWPFLEIEKIIADANTTDANYLRAVKLLRGGRNRLFRVWGQSRALMLTAGLVVLIALIAAIAALSRHGWGAMPESLVSITGWRALALVIVGVALAAPQAREPVSRIAIGLLGLVLWIPAWIHLCVFDRLLLRLGRLERLRRGRP